MAKITLDYGQIEKAATELNQTSSKMQTAFTEIQNTINGMIPGEWDGDAANSYKDGLRKIINKFPDFVNAVLNEQKILDNAKANYGNVDTAVKSASL